MLWGLAAACPQSEGVAGLSPSKGAQPGRRPGPGRLRDAPGGPGCPSFPEPPGHRTRVQRPQLCFLPSPGRPVVLSEQVHQAASFTPTLGSRGAGCVGKQPPNRGPCLPSVPYNHAFTQSKNFRCFCTRDGIHQMLIMRLLSLSAILAPVLIAIYILQHFTLGREPTLMVPSWQRWAVKRRTICCLLSGAWSALVPARVHVCAHA